MNDILKLMPQMYAEDALEEKLAVLPPYDVAVRTKSNAERLIALQDIYGIYIPNKMSKEIYSKLYLSLLRSLQKKQSALVVRQFNENVKMIRQKSFESLIGGSDSFTVIGPSGIGKSSAISRAMHIIAEVPILRLENTTILPCLQVQTPADSSPKGLFLEILRKCDEALGTRYHESAVRSHATIDMLIGSVSQVALNHIGLLVVDEIQHVVNSKNGKNIIGALTQLINNAAISICLVGTPESTMFFGQEYVLARRALGLHYTTMEYGDDFRNFCRRIFGYCYVKEEPNVDESMLMWLYNHSGGNASVVVSLIHDSQEIAIMEKIEKLDLAVLNTAYEKRMSMLHDFIAPAQIKAASVKKEKHVLPKIKSNVVEDSLSIHSISAEAKKFRKNIAQELKEKGVQILEVSI